jgi:hypothetical protein
VTRPLLPGTTPADPHDTGEADALLLTALQSDDLEAALARLLLARLLVPVEAHRPSGGSDGDGAGGGDAEMSVPLLVAEAGMALPAFTCLASLARWRPHARPVPMAGARVILGAVAAGHDAVVVDVAGPCPLQLSGELLTRLAGASELLASTGDRRSAAPPHRSI